MNKWLLTLVLLAAMPVVASTSSDMKMIFMAAKAMSVDATRQSEDGTFVPCYPGHILDLQVAPVDCSNWSGPYLPEDVMSRNQKMSDEEFLRIIE